MNFFTLLTTVFITLKLTGYIIWSWWFVLFPLVFSFYAMYSDHIIEDDLINIDN